MDRIDIGVCALLYIAGGSTYGLGLILFYLIARYVAVRKRNKR